MTGTFQVFSGTMLPMYSSVAVLEAGICDCRFTDSSIGRAPPAYRAARLVMSPRSRAAVIGSPSDHVRGEG